MSEPMTNPALDGVLQSIATLRSQAKRHYDRSVNRDLSQQHWQGLLQRNVVAVLQQSYDDTLQQLRDTPLESTQQTLQAIQAAFDGYIDDLVAYAVQKHRGSCALSNFPAEHEPARDYIAEVLAQAYNNWASFEKQLTALLPQEAAENRT